jgi:hypothetical protein
MRRGTGAKLGGVEGLPLAAGAQHKEDGIQAHAIGGTRPAAAEAVGVGMRRQVHGDLFPEVIGDAPLRSDVG